ncbi:hypothetical protein HNR33_003356 [Brassicibacter mesophilus]
MLIVIYEYRGNENIESVIVNKIITSMRVENNLWLMGTSVDYST